MRNEANCTEARKLSSRLSYRVATARKCLSLLSEPVNATGSRERANTLNQVPFLVEIGTKRRHPDPVWHQLDIGKRALRSETSPQGVAVISPVRQQYRPWPQRAKHIHR